MRVQQGAAVCIQSAWRGYRERRRLLLWREAALVIQRNWRLYRREQAALRIQTAWRRHWARELYLRQRDITIRLQAVGRGYLARQRYATALSTECSVETNCLKIQSELYNGLGHTNQLSNPFFILVVCQTKIWFIQHWNCISTQLKV